MSEFLEVVSPNAKKELSELNAELLKTISNVQKINSMPIGGLTPSGANDALKSLTIEYQKQEKIIQNLQLKLQKAAENQVKNIEKQRLAEIKLSQDREKAFDKYEKQYQKEQVRLNASQNLYNKIQAKLNALSNEYKGLSAKKELGLKLTEQEEQKYNRLQNSIQKYDKTLKAVDASMGKYQRNVGNYASGYNALGNSVNQLTREMPAFANSVQTGFMAISNNLPIFFDAIQNTRQEIRRLRADGQQVPSLFSQLTSSVLSWGTALSVGVTLLTLFGDEIVDAIFDTKANAKAYEEARQAIEEKNQAEKEYQETMRKGTGDEISRSKIMLENAKNINLPMKERLKNIDELQKRYPDYLGNLSKQAILSGNTADAENRLNEALMKRGIAISLQSKLSKIYAELADIMLKLAKAEEDKITLQNATAEGNDKIAKQIKYENKAQIDRIKNLKNLKQAKEDEIQGYLNLYNSLSPYISAVRESTDEIGKNTKATKENVDEMVKYETNSKMAFEESIRKLEEETSKLDITSEKYVLLSAQLNLLKQIYSGLFSEVKEGQADVIDGIELTEEQVYYEYFAWLKLKQAADDYIKTLTSDDFNKAFDNIGLASAKMFFDFDVFGQTTFSKLIAGAENLKEKVAITFQAIGDVFQEVSNRIAETQLNRLNERKEQLRQEYEVAMLFAGDEADAKANIEKEYQRRQKELKRQEFRQKKQQALFNIAIDTAQGVVSALASTPPNVLLSIAIGAIGALQAGLVAAQPIPEFYKGTDNAPRGWAWTQEKGREIITDSKGVVKSTGNDKGRTLTYLNKGDKVFTAAKTKEILFNDEFNNILNNNSILPPTTNVNIDLSPIKEEISGLRSDIKNAPRNITVIDKNGIKTYEENNRYSSEIRNRKVMFKGVNFGN